MTEPIEHSETYEWEPGYSFTNDWVFWLVIFIIIGILALFL